MLRLQDLGSALERRQFGFALLGADLRVARRFGPLSDWLPAEGEPACASPLLLHMEEALRALRCGDRGSEFILPSMRLPAAGNARVTISIAWNEADAAYVVVTTPDYGGDQTDRLLASERREKLLLQQQADAAAARLRFADALYRDLVESAGDLVLRFGVDRKIVFANRRAAECFGVTREALLGRHIEALFPASGAENPWRLGAYAERPAAFETVGRDAAGDRSWLLWDVRFSGAAAGGEFQAVGRDVTAAKLLEAERDRAREDARAAALAAQRLAIAHDLHDTLARSIITLILEMGAIAKSTTDAGARAALQALQTTARDGLNEAREAIAKLRTREASFEAERIIGAFREAAEKRGLAVETKIAPGAEGAA